MTCSHVLGRLLGGACPLCTGAVTAEPPGARVPAVPAVDHKAPAPSHDPSVRAEPAAPLRGPRPVVEQSQVSPLGGEAAPVESPGVGAGNHIRLDLGPTYSDEPALEDLDEEAALALLRDLDADACRGSLAEFVKLAFHVVQPAVELEWGAHLQAVCDHVQWQLEDRDRLIRDPQRRAKKLKLRCQNLLINIPPRSLKTIILTCATVWAWLRWPSLSIMYLSANPRVASTSARMARDLMRSHWFRTTFATRWAPEDLGVDADGKVTQVSAEAWEAANPTTDELWELRRDQDALSDIGNTQGGVRRSRGLSSTITGEGCQWLIIDDPHDTRDGTDKVAKAVEDYDSAVHDRLNDPTTSIRTLIMQRVRTNDLSARWLEILDSIVHLRLPMRYEGVDGGKVECKCGTCTARNVFGYLDPRTVEGEVLHERFTPEYIAAAEKRLNSRAPGQLQQRPLEAGGVIFKVGYWNWYSLTDAMTKARPLGARTDPPFVLGRRRDGSLDVDWVDISVDATGGSTSDTASNLGIGAIAGKGLRTFLLRDLTPGPATWLQTMDHLRAAVRETARIAGHQPRLTVLIEKKALGKAAAEQLQKHLNDGDLRYPDGRPVKARVELYEPTGKGSKEDRADLMEPDFAAGLHHILDGDDANTKAYREEHEGFPRVDRDDRVDYTSQCLDHHRNGEADWVAHYRRKREAVAERLAAIASNVPG
jgi:hypothetical protein